MARSQRRKERERYYLLPGIGGRSYRRKQKLALQGAIVAGIIVSALLGGILYWLSRH
jgi:hypothetical protein